MFSAATASFKRPSRSSALALLEPRAIGFGIELDRLAGVLERLRRLARAVVKGAQVDVRQSELAPARLVQPDGLLVLRDRAGIVAERFQGETETIEGLEVRGIDPEGGLECLARGLPVVLDGKELAEIVVALGGVGLVADGLLELDLRRIEPADDHQVAAEDLVRFGVLQIELQRLGERFDRLADLLLREIGIAERVPAPGRLRTLLHVFREERLDLYPLGVLDVALELRDSREVVRLGYAGAGRDRRRRRGGLHAPGLQILEALERNAEQALRLRRFRSELDGAPELRCGLFEHRLDRARPARPRHRATRSGRDRRRRRARVLS